VKSAVSDCLVDRVMKIEMFALSFGEIIIYNRESSSSSSSSLCGLSGDGCCHSYKHPPGLLSMCSMIGGCKTNVEWCEIRFSGPEPGVTRSA